MAHPNANLGKINYDNQFLVLKRKRYDGHCITYAC